MYLAIFATVLGGLLPSLLWWGAVLKQDQHPEKKKNLISVFLLGILTAIPVILCARLIEGAFARFDIVLSEAWNLFITGALVEEVIKGLALYLFVFYRRYFSEPIDTFIYGATVALGFAAIENMIVITGQAMNSAGAGVTGMIAVLVTLRAVTSVVVHVVSSTFVAYGLYMGIYGGRRIKAAFGVLLGIGVHGVYNLLLSVSANTQAFVAGYALILLSAGWLLYRRVVYLQKHSIHNTHLDDKR